MGRMWFALESNRMAGFFVFSLPAAARKWRQLFDSSFGHFIAGAFIETNKPTCGEAK